MTATGNRLRWSGLGDRHRRPILVWKMQRPQRGDIIALEHPSQRGVILVKRVIVMPGDAVEIRSRAKVIGVVTVILSPRRGFHVP